MFGLVGLGGKIANNQNINTVQKIKKSTDEIFTENIKKGRLGGRECTHDTIIHHGPHHPFELLESDVPVFRPLRLRVR